MVVQTPVVSPSLYTLEEVKKHNTANDCRTVINGKIYNMSSFASRHSWGSQSILATCGKDGSAIYAKQHGSNTSLLQNFLIGKVK